MANVTEVVVGELVKNIISILQENIQQNIRLIKGVQEDADKLSDTLLTVQAVLADVEKTQSESQSIRVWLRKLKHATYDAEDILEDLSWEAQRRTHRSGCTSQVSHSVSTTCFDFNHIIFRHKIAKKLKSILGRFEDIAKEKSQFQLQPSNHAPSQTESELAKMRETSSRLSEPKIYGRDEDIKKVIAMLLDMDHSRTENVFILPIVGIGGLGKTTLAQLVFNNKRIVSSFQKRIWVCVSEPFDVKRVLKQILESLGVHNNSESLDPIESEVVKSLQDKKYLLVLDDVWNKNQDEWDKLRSSLTSGASGSSIMVTTRSTRVASITSSSPPYDLGKLSDEQCLSLLKRRALGEKGEEEHRELVPIGKEIAEKCKGVPLAAKSLGSLLASKTNKEDWEHVRDSPLWDLEVTEENTILPALRLSYNHLPSRLKQCFSYCSIYPKDSQLNIIKLIYLWMANGFIQTQGRLELEKVGDDMFQELLRLSFFQDTEEDDYGSTETCKMHDLMHDLACSVMVDECLIAEVGQVKGVVKTIRHLTVISDSEESSIVPDCVMKSELSLRTLSFFEPINNFRSFRFSTTLRVLNLTGMGLTTLPKSICQLQHLRYLDLASNRLNSLPEFICRLRNLQMLDLGFNRGLATLPLSIGTLQHLRYLNLSYTSIESSIIDRLSNLENLRYLNLSRTSIESSIIDRLSNLENLRYLDLSHCELSTSLPESTGRLKNLQRLNLSGSGITSLPVSIGNMENLRYLDLSHCELSTSLPESTGRLKNLQRLNLSWSGITSLPVSIGNMENLRYLDLSHCELSTSLPESTGRLKNLQRLNLSSNKITSLPDSIGNMENLRYLDLSHCELSTSLPESTGRLKNLQRLNLSWSGITSLPVSIGNMESLRYLDLSWCTSITSLPESVGGLRNLESLILSGCESLEVLVKSMRNMSSLRHLDLQWTWRLTEMPVGLGELTCLQTWKRFVVGADSECGGINELHGLNQLRGELEITRLGNVRNAEDAKEAKLSSKRFLKKLSLSWDGRNNSNSNSKEVLEALLVPPNLQELEIYGYPGEWDCFHQGIQHLTSLQSLRIDGCGNLRKLEIRYLTSLHRLEIRGCSELELEIEDFQHLISLRELRLSWLPKLRALPLPQHLTMLKTLIISSCENLTSLSKGLQYLTSLHRLEIGGCSELELETEDFQHLTALRKLELWRLPKLRALSLPQHLTMLQILEIRYCKNLRRLPDGIQHLTSLQSLYITNCHEDLHTRCEKEKGDDWHLISHIPNISQTRDMLQDML